MSKGFRHDALFYNGRHDFVARLTPFIKDSVAAEEPILVVLNAPKLDLLRDSLGADAHKVEFADMSEIGANPNRIIPAWVEFVEKRAGGGRAVRGIGEPIWAERSMEELVECEHHEALLNLAFAGATSFWLACPYDTESLGSALLEGARRNHPFLVDGETRSDSSAYRSVALSEVFGSPLKHPPADADALSFSSSGLGPVRTFVAQHALEFGLDAQRTADLVVAANELATNSLKHGGGSGTIRMWTDQNALMCEAEDMGRIDEPLVGRLQPRLDQHGGRGLWLVNHLSDFVQVRSYPTGSVVRIRFNRP